MSGIKGREYVLVLRHADFLPHILCESILAGIVWCFLPVAYASRIH